MKLKSSIKNIASGVLLFFIIIAAAAYFFAHGIWE
jgi:hypothetical protein